MKHISILIFCLLSISMFAQKSGFTLKDLTDNNDFEPICYTDGNDTLSGFIIQSIDVIDGYEFVVLDILGNEVENATVLPPELCRASQDYFVTDVCYIDPTATNGINGKRWDSELNAAPHSVLSDIFSDWETHINGAEDEFVVITNNWGLNDADFPLTGGGDNDISSQELYYAYIHVTEPLIIGSDNNGNTGEQLRMFIQDCNKDMIPIAQTTANTNRGANGLDYSKELCEGFYKIAIQVSDFSVFGGFTLRYSTDGGETFSAFPIANTYTSKPNVISQKIYCYADGSQTLPDGTPFIENTINCEYACYPITREPLPDVEVNLIPFCDDVTGDPADYINATLEVITTNGEQTSTAYTNYGDDDNQVEYQIQGTAVDCATGEPIVTPPIIPECEDVEFLTAYAPVGENGVNVERWITNAIVGEPVTTSALDVFVGNPDYSGLPPHDNGAPDGPIVVESDLRVSDGNGGQDQFRYWTYLYITEPMRIRDRAAWAEATAYYLGECCIAPTFNVNGPYPNTGTTPFDVTLQPGIHYLGGTVFDFSAASGVDYQYSLDNGVSWARIPSSWLYSQKPSLEACTVKACISDDGSFVLTDAETGEILGSEFSLKKPELCSGNITLASEPQCAPQTFYQIDPNAVNGVNVAYWGDNAAPHGNVSDIFTDFDTHANGAADGTGIELDWLLNDVQVSTNTGANNVSQDQLIAYSYIYLENDSYLRDVNGNTGEKGSVWIGECCADPVQIDELTTNTAPGNTSIFGGTGSPIDPIFLPSGLHWIGFQLADQSATGGIQLQYSEDGGVTYANFPASNSYVNKPQVNVTKGWYCSDGVNYNQDRSEQLDDSFLCVDPRCESSNGSGGETSSSPTAEEIADAIQDNERDIETRILNVQNNTNDVTLGVPAGTIGCIRVVEDTGTGLVYWNIVGTPNPAPSDPNTFVTTGPYHAAYNVCGIDLSLVVFNGSSTASDYSVIYEIWN